jgi:2-amino-4-hydroxy-6-hydroxymethyldihydropteridine diphosphokinase
VRCLVALGANLGDRHALLAQALAGLGRLEGTRLVAASRPRETPPERPADGGPYLNAAALLETRLRPRELLGELLRLERRLGRRRDGHAHGGPRAIDLDLILHGAERLQGAAEVPHPRFRGRSFVVGPACEVAPDLRDPVTGWTLAALREALR